MIWDITQVAFIICIVICTGTYLAEALERAKNQGEKK